MAHSPELAFQKIIAAAVETALPGTQQGAHPPANKKLPYVQFGQSNTGPHPDGFAIETEIHTWSEASGPQEVKAMQQSIRDQLHQSNNTKDGWSLYCIREVDSLAMLDQDENTWHGVQRYRAFASAA